MRSSRRPVAACLLALALALPPVAAPFPAAADEPTTQAEARRRVAQAAAELEDSTAAARAAAAALVEVESRLPAARSAAARARGELDGARARAADAERAAGRARREAEAAQERVEAAQVRVENGREAVGRLARRSYQQGPMAELRAVIDAEDPQDLLDRATLLEKAFDSGNDTLAALTRDRLALAQQQRDLQEQQRQAEQAEAEAAQEAERARAVAARAEEAAAAVADLALRRKQALAAAEAARAGDVAQYAQAQADSRALAERIRQANEERRRRAAAAAAAAKEARERAARAARAARSAAERERARRAAEQAAAAERQAAEPSPPREGRLLWPSDGPLTSRYGYRRHPIYGDTRFHAGIDIGSGYGSAVVAAADGYVTYAGPASGYGTLVLVSHGVVGGRDLTTAYAHQSSLAVSTGETVSRGQLVGRVGSEGNSTGPHLHFEVRRDGDPVDPLDWVQQP